MVKRGLAALVLAGFASGCAAAPPLVLNSNRTLGADDYDAVLQAWTRSDEVYHDLDRILFSHATFHSSEVRRAFGLKHPNVYGPGSEEAARLALTAMDSEDWHQFFLSASTGDPSWNDFDRDDSIWRITLQVDQGPVVDGQVDRVKTSANLRIIYPFVTDYAKTYRVRFPLATEGEALLTPKSRIIRMSIISALGMATLEWRLTQPKK